jgi:hypothetical protein
MLNGTLSEEVRRWRWLAHSVLEGVLIVSLFCTAGPLMLFLVDGGGGAHVLPHARSDRAGSGW